MKIVPTDSNSIRINPGICSPFNADFDGDEMNGFFLYSKTVDEYTKCSSSLDYDFTDVATCKVVLEM